MTLERLKTLRLIRRSTTVTVRDVSAELKITEDAAWMRLNRMRQAGLVKKEGEGRRVSGSRGRAVFFYSLTPRGVKRLAYWNEHLEDIDGQID
jgi:predicted ArsR family transcriptional regulator